MTHNIYGLCNYSHPWIIIMVYIFSVTNVDVDDLLAVLSDHFVLWERPPDHDGPPHRTDGLLLSVRLRPPQRLLPRPLPYRLCLQRLALRHAGVHAPGDGPLRILLPVGECLVRNKRFIQFCWEGDEEKYMYFAGYFSLVNTSVGLYIVNVLTPPPPPKKKEKIGKGVWIFLIHSALSWKINCTSGKICHFKIDN